MRVSIIIPVLNESEGIADLLHSLQYIRTGDHELIVVDGGSHDGTRHIAEPLTDQLLISEPGRARQMNLGVESATGDWLLFLHADTRLPEEFELLLQHKIQNSERQWGWFNVRLSGRHFLFRIIERMINIRSRLTGIATGDQCIFVRRDLLDRIGGYQQIPLMEDVTLCKSLRKYSRPLRIKTPVLTSSRRWEDNGIWATVFLMWQLRLRYFLGVHPDELARQYTVDVESSR